MENTAKKQTNKSFSEQVDEVLAGSYNRYNALKVCDTPQILLDAGCEQLPMLYTQRHLLDAIAVSNGNPHKHNLDKEFIKSIPDLINAPAMIFDSLTKEDALIICTDKIDKDNNPIIISVKPNGEGIYELEKVSANFITSIYGKNNFKNTVEKAISNDKMLYWNKEKSQALFSLLQLQLPQGFNNLDPGTILHQSTAIVKQNKHETIQNITQYHISRRDNMKNLQWQPIVGTDKQRLVVNNDLILESRETWDDGAIYQLAIHGFDKAKNVLNFANEEERDEYVKENYPSIEREMLITKAKKVVETYTHDDAEPLGHLAEMAEMLGLGKPVDYLWYMQGKAGSADFNRDTVNKMYGYYGFTEGDIDKESGNRKLSWSIESLADNMLTGRITNVVESHGEDYIRAEDVHNLLDVLHADPAKLIQYQDVKWNLLHAAASTLGEHNEGFNALMKEIDGELDEQIKKGLETNDNLYKTPVEVAKIAIEERNARYEKKEHIRGITDTTIRDGLNLLYRAEEITGEYPVVTKKSETLIQATRNLKTEFESGKGAMCPETFMRNHITDLNDKTLRAFDYCANVISGKMSASAISAIIGGGKYEGWTNNDFAREYIKSAQELCNVASQYYGPVQFDDFKRHLDETAKRFGIGQEVGQKVQENVETKTNEPTKKLGAIRVAIWNASGEMRKYNYHYICDGVADYGEMIEKWKKGNTSVELPPKIGLAFYLKDANLNPDDEPLIYDIGDKRLKFNKRVTVFDAKDGYNFHMEEEIPDYATYPNKSYWKEWAFEIKKELWRRDIDENKKYGWPLGELDPDKDMFNIFAKRLKAERQKDSNKGVSIMDLGKSVYNALSLDERKYVNNYLDSKNIHSKKATEKMFLKAVGEPIRTKKRQHNDGRER